MSGIFVKVSLILRSGLTLDSLVAAKRTLAWLVLTYLFFDLSKRM